MRSAVFAVALAFAATGANAAALKPALQPLAFLVGDWTGDDGQVQDTGGRSRGVSRITVDANGGVLLRRDHTELTGPDGKPQGGFDLIMLIYPDADGIAADYSDGDHVIHYRSATVEAGRKVIFTSTAPPGAPSFRLSYELTAPKVLTLTFGMIPPGGADFRPIASGTLRKQN
jgi:hypothetical protein